MLTVMWILMELANGGRTFVMEDIFWEGSRAQLELGATIEKTLPEPREGCAYEEVLAEEVPESTGLSGQLLAVTCDSCRNTDVLLIDRSSNRSKRIDTLDSRPAHFAIVDLVGDRRPELLVEWQCGMRNSCTTLYRADADTFVPIGEIGTYGELLAFDFDRDGDAELLTSGCCWHGACSMGGVGGVAIFDGERYVERDDVLDVHTFYAWGERDSWIPSIESIFPARRARAVLYHLDPRRPASGVEMRLNGATIVDPGAFDGRKRSHEVTFDLDPALCNELEAIVSGELDQGIVVLLLEGNEAAP